MNDLFFSQVQQRRFPKGFLFTCRVNPLQALLVLIRIRICLPLTLTTAIQILLLTAATSFEYSGPQCLLTLTRSTSPPLDQFPLRVCSCPLCTMNRPCICVSGKAPYSHEWCCVCVFRRRSNGASPKEFTLLYSQTVCIYHVFT